MNNWNGSLLGSGGPALTDQGREPLSEPPADFTQAVNGLRQLLGVLERHRERFLKHFRCRFSTTTGLATGAVLSTVGGDNQNFDGVLLAWTLFVDNPSGYVLLETGSQRLVPATTYNYPLILDSALTKVNFVVFSGSDAGSNTVFCSATEGRIPW